MIEKRKFNFPLSLLVEEGDLILNAAESLPYAAAINPRLPDNFVADTRALAATILEQRASQKTHVSDLGDLTADQNKRLATLGDRMAGARKTAGKAFPGQTVKLREEFQVGMAKPRSLADYLERGRIVLASVRRAENVAALRARGWTDADTTALEQAIETLDATDDSQELQKTTRIRATGELNRSANEFYDRVLTIQNAADLEWPVRNGHGTIRAEFRLGKFPPRNNGRKGNADPAPPAPQE